MLKQPQPETNELTPEERAWVLGLYPGCPIVSDRLVLNQLQYMPNKDVHMLCYWYDNVPFQGTANQDWTIKRDSTTIKVYHKSKGTHYIIDNHNGDVNILRGETRSNLGCTGYGFQFLMKHYYAFPLFFGKGHWASGKNAFQLCLAVPNRAPLMELLKKLYDNDETLINDYFSEKKWHNLDLQDIDIFNAEIKAIEKQLSIK